MIFRIPAPDSLELSGINEFNKIRQLVKYAIQAERRWNGLLARDLRARAIQGSNSIEGYSVTFDEAVAVMVGEEIDVPAETRIALNSYRHAMDYILARAEDPHFVFNEEFIHGLHFMMMSGSPTKNPGRWRAGPIYVRRESTGERVYEGPPAEMVPGLMSELVESVNSQDREIPVIIRAAMAHLNFVMIHPFSDGNGRMARAIQTLLLAREEVTARNFMSIEEYLGSRGNTERYYQVLTRVANGQWRPERDARPWVRFCIQAHLQQAVTVQRRARDIERLWSELTAEISKRKLPERAVFALYEAAMLLTVRAPRYRAQAEITAQVASRDLGRYVQEGLLVPKGERRGRVYVASELLLSIREQVREPRIAAPQIQLGLPL